MNKYVVYLTYGVYVDTSTTDEEVICELAVAKMFDHGQYLIVANAEFDIEDVTEEFDNE